MVGDDLFPSGPWTGFYNYQPQDKHRMDLHLSFAGGRVSGDGNDDVGRFLISGHYDAATRECSWTKTYPGSHEVQYRGYREGKGIWGAWEIFFGVRGHGGFHIWPKGVGEGTGEADEAEAGAPVEAVGAESEKETAEVAAPAGPREAPRGHNANRRAGLRESEPLTNATRGSRRRLDKRFQGCGSSTLPRLPRSGRADTQPAATPAIRQVWKPAQRGKGGIQN